MEQHKDFKSQGKKNIGTAYPQINSKDPFKNATTAYVSLLSKLRE